LGRRRPDTGQGPDDRSDGQRLHDALADAAERLLRTGELPSTARVATTLLITPTLEKFEARAGQATTCHGATISIDEALRLAAGAKALPVVLGDGGGVLGLWPRPPARLPRSTARPYRARQKMRLPRLPRNRRSL
jgi:hypothetical protein